MSGFSSSPFEEKGNLYSVAVDMNYFHPSEMSVKVIDNAVVVVEAKHKERADEQYGSISRHFLHRYRLPTNVDPASITSDLSDKGILTVTARKRREIVKTRNNHTHQQEIDRAAMEVNSHEESEYIFDDYHHPNPELLYSVTRTPGRGVPESEFQCLESRCDCPDSQCTEQNKCSCLKYGANYNLTEDGLALVKEKLGNVPIFECNCRCSCFRSLGGFRECEGLEPWRTPGFCPNRNVQFGPIEGLEVFNAGAKGLGLRTKRKIRSGAFICEYAGEVISLEEARKRQKSSSGMNYVFVLREHTGDELSRVTCVDPTHVGNIGRYINHSCQPNSAIVPVRVNDTVPWLCVFAIRDIEEGEEICYDYSGRRSMSAEGKVGNKPCFCNSAGCKNFLPFEDI